MIMNQHIDKIGCVKGTMHLYAQPLTRRTFTVNDATWITNPFALQLTAIISSDLRGFAQLFTTVEITGYR